MANSAAVQLAVQILGDNGHLRASLNNSNQAVNKFSSGVLRASVASAAGFASITAAAAASVYAIHSVSIENALLARDLSRMAASANESVTGIQRAEAATRGLGFEQGKMADILKDFQEKLGDFATSGGGEFKDFFEKIAPRVGLTTEALQKMSGTDALIAVKKAMDDVNVSASQQTAFLEAIANDASALTPLLEDNGRAFKDLADDYVEMNSVMTEPELENYKQYAKNVDQLGDSFDSLVRETLNPYIKKLGEASKAMAELFGQWRVNVSNQRIDDNYLNKDDIEADIAYIEKVRKRYPSVIDGMLTGVQKGILRSEGIINNRVVGFSDAVLQQRKEQLKQVRSELEEQLEHNAQLLGKPSELPNTPKSGAPIGEDESSSKKTPKNRTADLISNLNLKYADETGKLALQHAVRLEKIKSFELSASELKRQGFESNNELQRDYALREDEFYNRELEKVVKRKQEKAQSDLDSVLQEQMTLQDVELEAQKNRQLMIDNALSAGVISREKHQDLVEKSSARHQGRLLEIQSKQTNAQLKNYEELFGGLAGVMKTAAGEQSGLYKAMFVASKAFSIAQSIISIKTGIAKAWELGWPLGIPAAAAVVSSTADVLSTIKGTSLKGMAHDGIDSIPEEGTWLLDKGERVLSRKQNKIFSQLESNQGFPAGNVKFVLHVNNLAEPVSTSPISQTADGEFQLQFRRFEEDTAGRIASGDSPIGQAIEQTFSLDRVGR